MRKIRTVCHATLTDKSKNFCHRGDKAFSSRRQNIVTAVKNHRHRGDKTFSFCLISSEAVTKKLHRTVLHRLQFLVDLVPVNPLVPIGSLIGKNHSVLQAEHLKQ